MESSNRTSIDGLPTRTKIGTCIMLENMQTSEDKRQPETVLICIREKLRNCQLKIIRNVLKTITQTNELRKNEKLVFFAYHHFPW